jgi:hypothetical protein
MTRPIRSWLGAHVLAGVMAAMPGMARAWGADAHRIVASVAQKQLSPGALAEVNRLLALEPGSTLESISTWADEVRSPTTAAWHYLNFRRDDGCRYDAMANCPGGHCVVAAIDRQLKVLGGKGPDEERLKALRYVTHFIADLHQPLHAGFGDDRGGNLYQVQAYGRGTNLHAVWDTLLVAQWPGGVPALKSTVEARAVAPGKTDPVAWAEASCRIVATEGFYPTGRRLELDYLPHWAPVIEIQLAVAARRLADAVNGALESSK